MSDSHPETLIEAYFAGKLDAGDAGRVRAFLEATPSRRGFVAGMRAAIRGEDIAIVPDDREKAVGLLIARIRGEHAGQIQAGTTAVHTRANRNNGVFYGRTVRRPLWWVASVGVAAALLALVVYKLAPKSHGMDQAVTTYVTAKGELAKIELADGSTVLLNVASRLEIPKDFGAHNRTVSLSGEADFQVAHTTGSPFMVKAGGMRAKVLGTEFAVRSYEHEAVRVAVRSGRVVVNHAVLSASDVAYATLTGQVRVVRAEATDAAFGFVTRRLILSNTRLGEVIPDLDRWYDVDIRLGDPAVGDAPIDAVLFSGSMSDLIETLHAMPDVRVVQHGRTITLFTR